MANLTAGLTFNGGGILKIKNATTGEIKSYDMVSSDVIVLPNGNWDMFFVGFQGDNPWQGPHLCGGVRGIELSGVDRTVDISVTAQNCGSSPYAAMIAAKGGTVAGAKWNDPASEWNDPNAKWGP